ncbi:MAG TPA: hypothetical protein VK559_04065 [Ferruginibacter sp.]|nr:hypothetical protein [Ferruginibacter sp.]
MLKRLLLFVLITLLFHGALFAQAAPYGSIQSFIPKHYEILDSVSGDINRDSCTDVILILKSTKTFDHPVLLLEGNGTGNYFLAARNDSVVLCEGCGGECCHEPYQQMVIGKDYFSFAHYGGDMNIHWTRLIAFTFDLKTRQYVLRKDVGIFKDAENPNATRYVIYGKEAEGILPFIIYSYNKF